MDVEIHEMTPEEQHELFDGMAQHYLGMTAEQFQAAWEAGRFDEDADRPEVIRLAMFLPFGGQVTR